MLVKEPEAEAMPPLLLRAVWGVRIAGGAPPPPSWIRIGWKEGGGGGGGRRLSAFVARGLRGLRPSSGLCAPLAALLLAPPPRAKRLKSVLIPTLLAPAAASAFFDGPLAPPSPFCAPRPPFRRKLAGETARFFVAVLLEG